MHSNYERVASTAEHALHNIIGGKPQEYHKRLSDNEYTTSLSQEDAWVNNIGLEQDFQVSV